MDKQGTFIYRCRRCGETLKIGVFPHLPASTKALCIVGSARDQLGREQFVMRPHTCPDGHVGIADIIGGEYLELDKNRLKTYNKKD